MRILLVEDHDDLRGVMKALFEIHGGWQVCGEAINGIEAVKKADELKPDLVIMDLSMPKMNGLQASALISASTPDTPILLYTNYSLPPDAISQAKKAGVWEVLPEGGTPEMLLQAVEALHVQAVARAAERAGKADKVGTLPDEDLALDPEGSSTA